jgi:hypothetical protein
MNTCEPNPPAGLESSDQPLLIRKKDLARRLSVSPSTVDCWVARREIPFIQVTPRLYLYDFNEVLAAIRKKYQIAAR